LVTARSLENLTSYA